MKKAKQKTRVADSLAPLFDILRLQWGTRVFVVATAHFKMFVRMGTQTYGFEDLREMFGLKPRPAAVFFTALQSLGLISWSSRGIKLTARAYEWLGAKSIKNIGAYTGLDKNDPGVIELRDALLRDTPMAFEDTGGMAYAAGAGINSAMDTSAAEALTLALAGRAAAISTFLPKNLVPDGSEILDLGCGGGDFAGHFLQESPSSRARLMDTASVLRLTERYITKYNAKGRFELVPGDMFNSDLGAADVVMLFNVLHDWDVEACQKLIKRAAAALRKGGKLLILEPFFKGKGPQKRALAFYSVQLFTITPGKVHHRSELEGWLSAAGMKITAEHDTAAHCTLFVAERAE